ncbi:MAG TPA: O-antigen ligase family protein [Terracidiphilus sp.]|jgi:O-antigen ligase
MHQLAAGIFVVLIALLFFVERRAEERTSIALWIPVLWLMIVGSRPVTLWIKSAPAFAFAGSFSEGSPVDAAIFGVLFAAGVIALNTRFTRVRLLLRANGPLLLFFAYCLLSALWSDYSGVALKRWIKAIGDVVMVLVVLTDPHPQVAIRRFFYRPAFVLLPMSVILILFFRDMGTMYDPIDMMTYYTGVTTNKNTLGVTCAACGLGLLWSWIGLYKDRTMRHRTRRLIVNGLLFATALGLILRANSMTSLSCLLIGSALMILTTHRDFVIEKNHLHLLLGAAIGLPVFALFFDTAGSMVHSLGRDSTLTGRTDIWRAVLSLHTNSLVGTGFESFWLGNRLQQVWNITLQNGIQEAHNGYIELYLNLGWVGLILLGYLIVTGYRHATDAFRLDPHEGRLRLAFFAACLVYSLTEAGFREMSPIWIGFILAAVLVPRCLQQSAHQPLVMAVSSAQRVRILQ